jgi:MurNAc alpha-1-phosphate uridylyltransferase
VSASVPAIAMVLAAGLGLRMRPITEHLPKPLIAVAGRTMLDRALDALAAAGVEQAIINVHHLAALIEAHVQQRRRPRIRLSHEPFLLETGGGIAKALPILGEAPFFAVNGDVLWQDGPVPALRRLAQSWDAERMDALLLLQATANAIGYRGRGDFLADASGRLTRRGERSEAPVLFAGLQIIHPRLFAAAPAGAFSLNLLYDGAIAAGRLFGLHHDGGWCHVGTPDDLAPAEAFAAPTLAAAR